MDLHRIVVNERDYVIDAAGADRASADILEAVRRGGDWVTIETVTGVRTTVLITSATPVRFEPVRVVDDAVYDEGSQSTDAWGPEDFDFGL
ncbi:MAG: hypothetical protein Q7T71_16270 [Herbiconiux sp.]|nr:hypothetical protein [Herbiconiux sp.]